MIVGSTALLDKIFLKKLDEWNEREVYAKIISLDFDERPMAEITGNVVSGSINVDGSSSVRRTCNLTLATNIIDVNETQWSLKTKFVMTIGLKNYVDDAYDDIIWFPMGTFIIASFNSVYNTSGYTISISGKDKMCMLNGDIGGTLFAAHDFGSIWSTMSDGRVIKDSIPIKDIIREAVHTYALEPYANIVINDLENCAVELISYRGKDVSIYVYDIKTPNDSGTYTTNICFSNSTLGASFESVPKEQYNIWLTLGGVQYRILKKCEFGDTIGYRATDLTYAGDLVVSAGGTVTQMLDKIVQMLGEFEYFYDLDGHFVFQRKPIYFNISWNNAVTNAIGEETYYESSALSSADAYKFNRGLLVDSFQNKPAVNAIKNDYAIWGVRRGANTDIPIHLRYAIDDKPKYYYSYTKKRTYISKEVGGQFDWRELIYQMAVDNLILRGELESNKVSYQQIGWDNLSNSDEFKEVVKTEDEILEAEDLYFKSWGHGYEAYYADMLAFWPSIYRTEQNVTYYMNDDGSVLADPAGDKLSDEDWLAWQLNDYWNPDIVKLDPAGQIVFMDPQNLTFWIDFLDTRDDLAEYKTGIIGRRPKVISDDNVRALFNEDTPSIMFIDPNSDEVLEDMTLSYIKMNIPTSLMNYFYISTQGKSAKETLDQLLYETTFFQETITLSAVPIYYLQPNTRIGVYDESSGINGEYIIKSISYQLSHDGMMSVQATRAVDRIL